MSQGVLTAARAGLVGCAYCGLVCRRPGGAAGLRCPRCRGRLNLRKPNSLARTWALLVASALLYIPANLLPVMHTGYLFGRQNDTILSGIVSLWTTGSKGLAVLVFFASITVPLLKIGTLGFLAVSVHRRSRYGPRQRALLFRLVDFVGRWSMLDVFVVTLMVGLVRFGPLANIEAGPGAAAFGAVVLLTMFAAQSFDPRLIWDPFEDGRG